MIGIYFDKSYTFFSFNYLLNSSIFCSLWLPEIRVRFLSNNLIEQMEKNLIEESGDFSSLSRVEYGISSLMNVTGSTFILSQVEQ